jgi:hypothetical protein
LSDREQIARSTQYDSNRHPTVVLVGVVAVVEQVLLLLSLLSSSLVLEL